MINKIFASLASIVTSGKANEKRQGESTCNIVVPAEMRSELLRIMSDREGFIYLLRMFWQRRFDKMSFDYLPVMDWLSRTFLPADLVAAKYHYPSYDGPRCLEDEDHYALAKMISDAAFTCPAISEILANK